MNNLTLNTGSGRFVRTLFCFAMISALILMTRSRDPMDPDGFSSILATETSTREERRAIRVFETRLNRLARDPEWDQAFLVAVEELSIELGRPAVMTGLAVDMAHDRLRGGNRTIDTIESHLRKSLAPVSLDYAGEVRRAVAELATGLDSIHDPPSAAEPLRLEPNPAPWRGALRRLGIGTGIGTAAFSTDALYLTGSGGLARIANRIAASCVRLLGPLSARATTLAAGTAIDGPLPFGDVVAIVGLVWTAHELNNIRGRFQEQVRELAVGEVRTFRERIHAKAMRQARNHLTVNRNQNREVPP